MIMMRWSRPIRLSLLELQLSDSCGETTHTSEEDHLGVEDMIPGCDPTQDHEFDSRKSCPNDSCRKTICDKSIPIPNSRYSFSHTPSPLLHFSSPASPHETTENSGSVSKGCQPHSSASQQLV
jgi:hypothetical protein